MASPGAPAQLLLKHRQALEWGAKAGAGELVFYRLIAAAGPPESLPMIVRCYSAVSNTSDAVPVAPWVTLRCESEAQYESAPTLWPTGFVAYGPGGAGVIPSPAPESGRGAVVAPAR